MSKKETIESRVKALTEREQKIKKQLDNDSDEMKDKAMRVGKIALVAGGVALLGYWLFNIFSDDDEEVEKPKKKKKHKRSSPNTTARITALLMPYLNKFLDGVLDDEDNDKKEDIKKEEGQETD
ncbi:hypothetical protein [Ekhidna sp.]|uniref:hypothetical protein n=1 Tax=Ekhidna sp. TaxID=2608089 RepID=UPI003B5130CF